jgi:hypothetical protein
MHGLSLGVEASYWNKEKVKRRLHWCCIYATIFDIGAILREEENRDTVSHSKEVADSVHLDPWRTGICPVCFG